MVIVREEEIVRKGAIAMSPELRRVEEEIREGIKKISWPESTGGFFLDPESRGKGTGEGNGVKPIKNAFIASLKEAGWDDEKRAGSEAVSGTGPLDAVKMLGNGKYAVEWETGNISSSHRALNKICLGVLDGKLLGGTLVVPSENLYKYLTDRIGNYRELVPYLPLWKKIPYTEGAISIIVVEYDGLKQGVPRIPKGTDGRAKV